MITNAPLLQHDLDGMIRSSNARS